MKVQVKETGEIVTLQLTDARGINWAADFIGNHDGFGSKDHQISLTDDYGMRHAFQETVEYWAQAVEAQKALDDRIAELKEEHGTEAVHEALEGVNEMDLLDEIAAFQKALDEAFGE